MPAKGQRHTEAARARIAEGIRRAQRPWRGGLRLLPAHIADFAQAGKIHLSLRPSLRAAVREVAAYADSLGGRDNLAEGELLTLEGLLRAKVILNAKLQRYLTSADEGALEGCAPWLLAESRALSALGLKRRPRAIPDLATYLAERNGSPTLDVAPGEARSVEAELDVTSDPAARQARECGSEDPEGRVVDQAEAR
jgi:hypothetical protein